MTKPHRKTQGSSWSEIVRTAQLSCSTALFGVTVLFIVDWQGAFTGSSANTANSALLGLAVVIDAVLIFSLIGLAAHRPRPLKARVTVPTGERGAPTRRR